ncbi:MAG TPA: hypothetical protein VIO62_08560 [Candidatus Dormibacteraeota bacterium]|jgi:hypothetical protein
MFPRWAPVLVGVIAISACGTGSAATLTNTGSSDRLPVVALPGYQVTQFTAADSRLIVTNPDSVIVDGKHVFIDYQNTTAKDCTDTNSSTVLEYDLRGKILGHWTVAGHSDGMRMDPATHLIWTTSCEDGNPKFATIDPATGEVKPYTFPTPPHGGGYDDLYFVNGTAFVAASNPTLDASGNNPNPVLDKIALGSNGQLILTPVLNGDATAVDLLKGNAPTQLTLTDPDSLYVDTTGQLVLVSQADSELIFINNPGTPQQAVSKLAVGDQLDDTVFPTGAGRLLVVDGSSGITYWISGRFAKGDIYTQAPNDSGTVNFVGTIDPSTGFVTPIAIGFLKATGMVFVPN